MIMTQKTCCLKQFFNEEFQSIDVTSQQLITFSNEISQLMQDNPKLIKQKLEGDLISIYEPDIFPEEYDYPEGRFPWEKAGMSIRDFF